jgi:hypothetical protein
LTPEFYTLVNGCPRCGADHGEMEAFPLPGQPIRLLVDLECEEYEVTPTYWCLCPTTNSPIMCQLKMVGNEISETEIVVPRTSGTLT